MHVMIVYKEEYPWDVRVEKLALSLKNAGHEVTILARNRDAAPVRDSTDGMGVSRLPALAALPRALRAAISTPFLLNPLWIVSLLLEMRRKRPALLIVRDVPLGPAVAAIGRLVGVPVVLDMAEAYPEMYASMMRVGDGSGFLKHPALARLQEWITCSLANAVLVMIEESRDRLERLGVPGHKLEIVSNTPSRQGVVTGDLGHKQDEIRIVYVGFVTRLRGLELLVRGVSRYLARTDSPESIRVDIIGRGSAKEELQRLCLELELGDRVRIHGWLSQEAVDQKLAQANVGALTYPVCGHWNHTIPNKLFDYMKAGLPVLATEVIPIARIVRDTEAGLVCRDGDPDSLADALEKLRDPSVREHLGRNGAMAVEREFNWELDSARFLAVCDRLASDSSGV